MIDKLSAAPIWIQVLAALGLFFFLAVPIVASIIFLVAQRLRNFNRRVSISDSPESQFVAGLLKQISLSARVVGLLLLLSLFTVWIAFPLYMLISLLIFELLRAGSGATTFNQVIVSGIVSISTCIILELALRRMPSAKVLWEDVLVAFPKLSQISSASLIMGARFCGAVFLSTIILHISEQ